MGCVLCNITSCKELSQGGKQPLKNPFFCKTKQERDEFLEELTYDIAVRHPELVAKINSYLKGERR